MQLPGACGDSPQRGHQENKVIMYNLANQSMTLLSLCMEQRWGATYGNMDDSKAATTPKSPDHDRSTGPPGKKPLSSATVTALGGNSFMNLASFSLETCRIVYFLSLLSYPLLHKWMFEFWGNHCTQASFMTEIWKDHNIHLTPQPLNSCPSHMQNIPILLKSLIKKLTWSSITSDASSPESPLNII